MQLTPAPAAGAEWSRSGMPTLVAGAALDYLVAKARCPAGMLLDWSKSSALDCDGNWEEAMGVLAGRDPLGETLAHLEAAFMQHVAPLEQGYKTRTKDWTKWRSVVTWGAARECLPQLLPMSMRVLRCLVWDALGANCSYSVIKALVDAIQTRHRRLGLPRPVQDRGSYSSLMRSLQRFQGQQAPLYYPIHKDVVRRGLLRVHLTRAEWRDCLAMGGATMTASRPDEGSDLQSCDFWYEWDVRSGFPGLEGSAVLNVMRRKNDVRRKGHWPRLGRSTDPGCDIVYQLRRYIEQCGLAPAPTCTKRQFPHRRCVDCPSLFPMTLGRDPNAFDLGRRTSPKAFVDMVVRGVGLTGLDTTCFSGVSARKGGLSTAIEAGVPEHILWMQSGHAQTKAARVYVHLRSPTLLYDTWKAFGL